MYVLYTCGALLFDCLKSLFFNLFILCMHSTRFKCYTYKRIGTKAFNRPEMFYQYKSVIYLSLIKNRVWLLAHTYTQRSDINLPSIKSQRRGKRC